jgi:hypothetical protein
MLPAFREKYVNFIKKSLPEHFWGIRIRHMCKHKFFYSQNFRAGVKNPIIYNKQIGGYREKQIEFNNYKFRFMSHYDGELYHVYLLSKEGHNCLALDISKKYKEANIQELSYYESCAIGGLKSPGGGTILLEYSLDHLQKHKRKYGIIKISLQDNSSKPCVGYTCTVNLARYRIITKGDTWYSIYGFTPYDSVSKQITMELQKKYNKNKETLKVLTVSDVNIKSLIKRFIQKVKLDSEKAKKSKHNVETKKIKLDVEKIIDMLNKNILVRDFFLELGKKYDKNCCLLAYLSDRLFEIRFKSGAKLYDFHFKSFYLDI